MTFDDFKSYPGENADCCGDCGVELENGSCVVIECPVYQLEVHGGPSVVDAPALPVATETVIDRFDALKRRLGGA
jgi:hypothetical protein